jgi:ubiquinone/menaquinone biosynthesis C-methylase UbiE
MGNQEQTATAVSQETERVRSVYALRKEPGGHISLYGRCAMHEREERLVRHFVSEGWHSLEGLRILEVGCGAAALLRRLFDLGAEPTKCVGVDVRGKALQTGRSLSPARLNLVEGTGTQLPFRDGEFDVALQFTVFTSILDHGVKRTMAGEMLRTLRRGGRLIWYDFAYSNPHNPQVKGIGKREVAALLAGCKLRFERVTLAPPIGRAAVRVSPLLYHLLSLVPMLRTHYLCFAEKL